MPRLVQINVTVNRGSTGKIAEQIGRLAMAEGWTSTIAYGRMPGAESHSDLIRIGSDMDVRLHGLQSRIFDNHGLGSIQSTRRFINQLNTLQPDIIHLHNIHGYYLNYPILFDYLKNWGGPVVWTLHDCWPFTGHCAYFMMSGCDKWRTGCHDCGSLRAYPASFAMDRSKRNFELKKECFTSLGDKLTLVPVSDYVGDYIGQSFFKDTAVQVIHNGIDVETFRPSAPKENMIIGVANVWEPRKGLPDFYKLRQILPADYRILLVGLSKKQLKSLPDGIEGITRTSSQDELARLYSSALALVNPTYEDNFPTVNIEAMACGTPVVTYQTGGSPESLTITTGFVVKQGDVNAIADAVTRIKDGALSPENCRRHAVDNFNQADCFQSYIDLYKKLIF